MGLFNVLMNWSFYLWDEICLDTHLYYWAAHFSSEVRSWCDVFFIISSSWFACLLAFISEGRCIWQRPTHLNTHKHAHIHTTLFITLIGTADLAANPQKHLQLGGINIDLSTVSLFLKAEPPRDEWISFCTLLAVKWS